MGATAVRRPRADVADLVRIDDLRPITTTMQEHFSLDDFYDAYPRIEDEFQAALDVSLRPRGPDLLYELVDGLGMPAGSRAVDVGCGEGGHTLRLAERFGFVVTGIDPVPRHVDLAREALAGWRAGLGDRVGFALGVAEALPVDDASVDLVWCRDVLVHVADVGRAYREFRRVLRPSGRALVYQMFATERLEPREAASLWATMGGVAASADQDHAERAMADAGLRVDRRVDIGTEWGEWGEERTGAAGRRLLHAARLLRAPERYVAQFGQAAYEIMLSDALWHVYGMIGKLTRRAYVLSAAQED